MPVIGVLASASAENPTVIAFRQGLEQAGYREGRNVAIEFRSMQGQYDRATPLATELVAHRVDLIMTGTFAAALAAKAATTTIPIVFAMGDDPVQLGLVASLNKPGGTITGVSFISPAIEAKRLELLHELIPAASTIAALVNPKFPSAEVRARSVRDAASALGLRLDIYNASSDEEIDAAFATIAAQRTGAVLVTSDPYFDVRGQRLVHLATRYALPTAAFFSEFAEAGGLMSYGANVPEAYRAAGVYAGRVLKGEKPADLLVLQPTKIELLINNKTARALGITVPRTLLVAADEVIE
jgi:putative ABC transport system substrate-binding protein